VSAHVPLRFEAAAAECAKRISDAKAGLEELYLTPVDEAHRAVLLKQEAAVSHAQPEECTPPHSHNP
jgi:hypothetical protein